MSDLATYRRAFAEGLQLIAGASPALVDAFAAVPRERFLEAGPWLVRAEGVMTTEPRLTPGDDPRWLCHNVAVAIDPARTLFNGAPAVLAAAIDALALAPGHRVLHVGAGTGYYTALMAHVVGATGRVLGLEIDPDLASRAALNAAGMRHVEIRQSDGRGDLGETFDAMLVNAGVTHPERTWLEALAPAGRMVLPLTATFTPPGAPPLPPPMSRIGKGFLLQLTRTSDPSRLDVRPLTMVAIYSAVGLRHASLNDGLGRAMMSMRSPLPPMTSLRLDAHEADQRCWLHADDHCWRRTGGRTGVPLGS